MIDRAKDMINRSGLKVYPARVEKVLRLHEQVADVAVVGRPDTVHTEKVVAVVVPKTPPPDANAMTESLRALCRQHLAPYEVPAVFELVESLPRSPLGKLLRRELRQGGATPAAPAVSGNGSTSSARSEAAGQLKEKETA